jgi:hypothetical protein
MLIMTITNLSHVREGRVKVEKGQGDKVGSNPYLASIFPPPVDIDSTIIFYEAVCSLDYSEKHVRFFPQIAICITARVLDGSRECYTTKDDAKGHVLCRN